MGPSMTTTSTPNVDALTDNATSTLNYITTEALSSKDLFDVVTTLANINLGYLGVSVAILGVLGGVFVYFNIKPLQEKLGKQEEVISDLLGQSEIQTRASFKEFEERQTLSLSAALEQQKENVYLEVTNKIQVAESTIMEKIDSISNDKDLKLKEILLSEMSNKILSLEKSLTLAIEQFKNTNEKEFSSFKNKSESQLKKITADILELKAYKYDMEGRMGGIIFTIDALEKCLNDEPFMLQFSLDDLKEKIGKYTLSPELFIRLRDILKSIEKTTPEKYTATIKEIQNLVRVEEKPDM